MTNRTHYTFTITAREREAIQRILSGSFVADDPALLTSVLRQIADETQPSETPDILRPNLSGPLPGKDS